MKDDEDPKPVARILKGLQLVQTTSKRPRERLIDAAVLLGSPDDPLSVLY